MAQSSETVHSCWPSSFRELVMHFVPRRPVFLELLTKETAFSG